MNFRDRRSVDDAFDIRPKACLPSVVSSDDRPDNNQADWTHSDLDVASLGSTDRAAAGSEQGDFSAAPPRIDGVLPTDYWPMIQHFNSERILDIHSLKDQRISRGDSRIQGLYLVSTARTGLIRADIIFIHENFRGSHPYYDWLNKRAPDGDYYLPDAVQGHIPYARVWAYGYQINVDDKTIFSSAANNFLVYYDAQRRRDRKNNPNVNDATLPKLVFICAGMGGTIVKKVLLDCLLSRSSTQNSIARSCHGIVFLGTPHHHIPKPPAFIGALKWLVERSMHGLLAPFFSSVLNELKSINQDFVSHIAEMPSTFCVVNRYNGPLFGDWLLPKSDTLSPASILGPDGRDDYLSITERIPFWGTSLHKKHSIFTDIMTRIQRWVRIDHLATAYAEIPPRGEQVTGGVNLLSFDGGGVRGLASLLVMERIMREIARIEVAADPSTRHRVRIPADYFDLAGGTSTGGLICIMLFRLRMDVQSAIVEYRRLSPQIFRPSATRYLGSNIAKTIFGKAWFKGENLEAGVKRIVRDRLSWDEKESLGARVADACLLSSIENVWEGSCKTFVCALKKENNSAIRFRSYPLLDRTKTPFINCKIWEAARATSAAPFYFPSAIVEGVKFWDGGLANNNPVLEVLAEQSHMYPGRQRNCVISVGTGYSERKPSKSTLAMLGKGNKILSNVTDVKRNDGTARQQLKNDSVPYFRFNPNTAEDEIGLADFKLLDALEEHTKAYLNREDVRAEIKQCAELLSHRSTTPRQAKCETSAG